MYARHPWDVEPSEYNAPSNSWEEVAIRQATVTQTMPRAQVQKLVRPPLPQIHLWGPKVRHMPAPGPVEIIGYSSHDNFEDRRTSLSGTSAGFGGSERNSQGWL
jgi:hypothetical protein